MSKSISFAKTPDGIKLFAKVLAAMEMEGVAVMIEDQIDCYVIVFTGI